MVDVKGMENLVIECDLRNESPSALLHGVVPSAEWVNISVGGSDDALGIAVEAHVPVKELSELVRSFDVDARYVCLDVFSTTPGGKVDRHNSQPGSTKIRLRDQIVEVCGQSSYLAAKELLATSEGHVRFAVMKRMGMKTDDVVQSFGSLQPRPSHGMSSQQWNLGKPVFACSHPGCDAVLQWWCKDCLEHFPVTQAQKHVLRMCKCCHHNGWWFPKDTKCLSDIAAYCPQHSKSHHSVDKTPCLDLNAIRNQ